MPFPLPPNKAGARRATQIQDQSRRIGVEERRVLPEPRSYYTVDTGTYTTSGATLLTIATVPIFWKPGNTIGVLMKTDVKWNTSSSSCQVTILNNPYTTVIPILTVWTPTNAYASRATNVAGGQGHGVLTPYGPQMVFFTPYAGQTVATASGTYNLTFQIARTAGTGTISAQFTDIHVMVF